MNIFKKIIIFATLILFAFCIFVPSIFAGNCDSESGQKENCVEKMREKFLVRQYLVKVKISEAISSIIAANGKKGVISGYAKIKKDNLVKTLDETLVKMEGVKKDIQKAEALNCEKEKTTYQRLVDILDELEKNLDNLIK